MNAISTPRARTISRAILKPPALISKAEVVVAAVVILVVITTAPVKFSNIITSGVDLTWDRRAFISELNLLVKMVSLPPLRLKVKALLCLSVSTGIRPHIVPSVTFNCW